MADSGSAARRSLNPWVLHFQKLGLELKCPLCLNLFNQPMLLPCDHIFCKSCLDLCQAELKCLICHVDCLNSAVRPSPHTENLVFVYRNMIATLSTLQSPTNSEVGMCPTPTAAAVKRCTSVELKDQISGSTNIKSKEGIYQDKCNKYTIYGPKINLSFEKVSTTLLEADGFEKQGDQVTETNPALQSAPDSPPSLDCPRVDDDSTDQGSEHSLQRDQTMYSRNTSLVKQIRLSQEPECCGKEAKRQKTSLGDFSRSSTKSNNQQEVDSIFQKSVGGFPALKKSLHAKLSNQSNKCAFCQSSKVAQKTGPMLHYFPDGVPANGDENLPNIVHAHEICLNWAPQVYFKDNLVKNLKGEVARAAKLKCSKCGRKGAPLGCSEKSCKKSFHVTCAMEISECRWDLDNFLLLCPTHASLSFPHEKSHKEKTTNKEDFVPHEISKDSSNMWVTSKSGSKPWLLCGSALTNGEKSLMMKLSTKHGIRVTKYWHPDVTHVIASTDANGACCRTLKVLMGISNGIWILNIDWINACLEAQCPVDEEPYEISIDNHGCVDGPKTGRMRALSNGPKIFAGLQFFFSGYFVPGFKRDLHNLLTAAGGCILSSTQELTAGREGHQTVIVYNLDPLNEDDASNPALVVEQRREEALNLAKQVGDRAVAHTWLLESIAACKLVPWSI